VRPCGFSAPSLNEQTASNANQERFRSSSLIYRHLVTTVDIFSSQHHHTACSFSTLPLVSLQPGARLRGPGWWVSDP
jgi:hypothetical protein